MKSFMLLVGLLLISAVTGCGQTAADAPTVPLHPFSGIIHVDGKPVSGAAVNLHPVGASSLGVVTPNGITYENGMFFLTTYRNADGAPEGEYSVTVSLTDVLNPGASDLEYGPEKLPRRYQSKDTSGLEFEVTADSDDTPALELRSR